MALAEGGCLCGQLRYGVDKPPMRVTTCHCRFCQRATGSAYLVEPLFEKPNFSMLKGQAKTYTHISEGSGKQVHVHFCDHCGTKIHYSFERFADLIGVFGGTFDDPDWFERSAENSKHIFLDTALHDTIIPAGISTFKAHTLTSDNVPIAPKIYQTPHIISSEED